MMPELPARHPAALRVPAQLVALADDNPLRYRVERREAHSAVAELPSLIRPQGQTRMRDLRMREHATSDADRRHAACPALH